MRRLTPLPGPSVGNARIGPVPTVRISLRAVLGPALRVSSVSTLLLLACACSPSAPSAPVAESESARAARTQGTVHPPRPGGLDLVSLRRRGALNDLPLIQIQTSREPITGGPARFEGYPIEAILGLLNGPSESTPSKAQLLLHLADGRTERVSAATLRTGGGVLAFRDLDAPPGTDWRRLDMGHFKMTPGPFYLVWGDHPSVSKRPWISQVEHVSWTRPSPTESAAFPHHVPSAQRGFDVFAAQCQNCHSVNFIGGRLGPELNVPQSVTETMKRDALRTYIKHPRQVRASATMPDFPALTESDLDDLVGYLRAMRAAKVCATQADCDRFRAL